MLKAHGHLLPADLEAAAKQDMAAEQLAAVLEGAPRVTVAAVPALKLKRSRSQHLRSSLDAPGARQLLQQAAQLAADGRVLGAAATLHQLAELVGGSVEELAALPDDALAAATPAGASLDVARVLADASAAREALRALEDHKGWMVSRDDALKVHYRHQRGTTVHRQAAGRARLPRAAARWRGAACPCVPVVVDVKPPPLPAASSSPPCLPTRWSTCWRWRTSSTWWSRGTSEGQAGRWNKWEQRGGAGREGSRLPRVGYVPGGEG